ncbi:hypothetical protein B0T26DRAFT_731394 [Lasiosphaeria miniovina]|uniref:Secreted protein n=1 Tax=Lasiosphaeria miniovina TaxID=1954250 RepID=A0AA39ZTK0_9PEZI|nr:uncharacterized protein B0T26DRAFT_731394 [Lasiosphaeria miniovina]KAK0703456.1 hypothetical protein B0T26DRAFT_731394 [Lasiosphaeria miniovina]
MIPCWLCVMTVYCSRCSRCWFANCATASYCPRLMIIVKEITGVDNQVSIDICAHAQSGQDTRTSTPQVQNCNVTHNAFVQPEDDS